MSLDGFLMPSSEDRIERGDAVDTDASLMHMETQSSGLHLPRESSAL
jgi:hypothetical protein